MRTERSYSQHIDVVLESLPEVMKGRRVDELDGTGTRLKMQINFD